MRLTMCDKCVASGICSVYQKNADRICCFGNYDGEGVCNQCTHESVFDLCKYLKNIIIILEEK